MDIEVHLKWRRNDSVRKTPLIFCLLRNMSEVFIEISSMLQRGRPGLGECDYVQNLNE